MSVPEVPARHNIQEGESLPPLLASHAPGAIRFPSRRDDGGGFPAKPRVARHVLSSVGRTAYARL